MKSDKFTAEQIAKFERRQLEIDFNDETRRANTRKAMPLARSRVWVGLLEE